MSLNRASSLKLLVCVALGVALRLATWDQVFSLGRAIPLSGDSVYHLRRARFAVRDFPKPLVFDPLINFPNGGVTIWPPLFDVALAAPAFLLRGPRASADFIERTSVFVPLLFAAGGIAAAGLAGLAVRRRLGWTAALFVAVCPGHFRYSQLGHTDQHVAEACLGFMTLAFFLWSCRRRSAWWDTATGLALAATVLTWQGAIFWVPLLGVGLLQESFRDGDASRLRPGVLLRRLFLILFLPTILVSAGTRYWLLGFHVPFSYVNFGWFQPTFLCFGTAIAAAALLCARAKVMTSAQRILAGSILILCFIPVVLHSREFVGMTLEGVRHLGSASRRATDPLGSQLSLSKSWLAQISEYQPLFGDGWGLSVKLLSFFFLLSPLAIALWTIRAVKGLRPTESATLAAWGAFLFLFTVFQQRNVYYASLLAALTAVELCGRAGALAAKRVLSRGRTTVRSLVICILLISLSAPMFSGLRGELLANYGPSRDLLGLLETLRALNPRPIDPYDRRFLDPAANRWPLRSAVSIMDSWSLGHYITYYAEWPVVADNFGYGFEESVRFFYAEDESEAIRIAQHHNSTLVLDDGLLPRPDRRGRILTELPSFWVGTRGGWVARARYLRTIEARLYDFDGRGANLRGKRMVEPLGHFDLLASVGPLSRRFGRLVPKWKVFRIRP